jgi:hypothetical protein
MPQPGFLKIGSVEMERLLMIWIHERQMQGESASPKLMLRNTKSIT